MPREDRRIYFEFDEVYKAIYALCVQKEIKKPPPGVIRAIVEDKEIPGKIIVYIENPHEKDSAASRDYTRDFLAAALMLYCRTCRIPLPKTASKSVELGQGNIILRVQI